ncbi:hypothetical protein BDR26DRAFT_869986 [Obelidium mucronatum]|nr:hypothetical protein BDR26DRAFT_869986 [Obelidium mucronatum]
MKFLFSALIAFASIVSAVPKLSPRGAPQSASDITAPLNAPLFPDPKVLPPGSFICISNSLWTTSPSLTWVQHTSCAAGTTCTVILPYVGCV